MRKKAIITVLMCIFLLMSSLNALAVKSWNDLTPQEQQAMFKVEQKVYPLKGFNPLASSTVNPIKVNDPFGSAGIPVYAEFTLSNVGAEFPFNQIPLPPDSFALVMAVDKEVGFRTAEGMDIDVFKKMTGVQKFMFLTGLGFEVGAKTVISTAVGQTCSYVDVYDNLPKATQDYIVEKNGGSRPPAVYMWDCLKISDEEKFKERIQESCEDQAYSTKCLAEINKQNANSILNTVVVALVSDVPRGTCEEVRGKTVTSWIAKNVVKCGIGENGLKPGESVTFRFVVTVPADTPVINDEDLAKSGEIQDGSFTYQASCIKSQFPKACHTIYAGVFPMATNNLLKVYLDNAKDLFQVGGCALNKLWYASQTSFEGCVEARATSIDVVGDPIYEGQGTFFILAPQLSSEITLVLMGALISGALSAMSLGRGGKK